MADYRRNFPQATILPKMHLLEDDVVPWLRRWHIGCGFMGEQGAESIHASFNLIARAYVGVRGRVEQFRLTGGSPPEDQSHQSPYVPLFLRRALTICITKYLYS